MIVETEHEWPRRTQIPLAEMFGSVLAMYEVRKSVSHKKSVARGRVRGCGGSTGKRIFQRRGCL